MDKKSKLLIWVVVVSIVLSVSVTFYKYVVRSDFEVFQNEDGLPVVLEE